VVNQNISIVGDGVWFLVSEYWFVSLYRAAADGTFMAVCLYSRSEAGGRASVLLLA